MKRKDPDLLLLHAPLLRQGMTTPKAMRDVIYALLPATAASILPLYLIDFLISAVNVETAATTLPVSPEITCA